MTPEPTPDVAGRDMDVEQALGALRSINGQKLEALRAMEALPPATVLLQIKLDCLADIVLRAAPALRAELEMRYESRVGQLFDVIGKQAAEALEAQQKAAAEEEAQSGLIVPRAAKDGLVGPTGVPLRVVSNDSEE